MEGLDPKILGGMALGRVEVVGLGDGPEVAERGQVETVEQGRHGTRLRKHWHEIGGGN